MPLIRNAGISDENALRSRAMTSIRGPVGQAEIGDDQIGRVIVRGESAQRRRIAARRHHAASPVRNSPSIPSSQRVIVDYDHELAPRRSGGTRMGTDGSTTSGRARLRHRNGEARTTAHRRCQRDRMASSRQSRSTMARPRPRPHAGRDRDPRAGRTRRMFCRWSAAPDARIPHSMRNASLACGTRHTPPVDV